MPLQTWIASCRSRNLANERVGSLCSVHWALLTAAAAQDQRQQETRCFQQCRAGLPLGTAAHHLLEKSGTPFPMWAAWFQTHASSLSGDNTGVPSLEILWAYLRHEFWHKIKHPLVIQKLYVGPSGSIMYTFCPVSLLLTPSFLNWKNPNKCEPCKLCHSVMKSTEVRR